MASLVTEGSAFLVIVDTGSSDTALAGAGCASCADVSPRYSPGSAAKDTGQRDEFEYANGDGWAGEVYTDTVGLGDDSPNVKLNLVDITTQDSFFYVPPGSASAAFQGVLGLGRDALLGWGTTAFMDAIVDAGVARKIGIEMCPTGGTLWLGGVDTTHAASALQYTPLIQSHRNSNFYAVGMTGMALGSAELGTASEFEDPIIDTGTSSFYIPDSSETALISAINSSAAFQTLFPGQTLTNPASSVENAGCVAAAPTTTDQMVDDMLPPLAYSFDAADEGGTITVQSRALTSYFVDVGNSEYCLVIFGGANDGDVVLGDTFLHAFVTEIDVANNRVGFAPNAHCPPPGVADAVPNRFLERGRGPKAFARLRDNVEARIHATAKVQ